MRSYVSKVLACAFAAICVIAALILAVDAFGLFGKRIIPTRLFPHNLRMTTSGDRVIKAIEIAHLERPLDILFVGSSRVAFAFDLKRNAVLLVAGDKSGGGKTRFYRRLIAKADERFDEHVSRTKKKGK